MCPDPTDKKKRILKKFEGNLKNKKINHCVELTNENKELKED